MGRSTGAERPEYQFLSSSSLHERQRDRWSLDEPAGASTRLLAIAEQALQECAIDRILWTIGVLGADER